MHTGVVSDLISGLKIHICSFSDRRWILLASNTGLHCSCACHCLLELLARLGRWHRAFLQAVHNEVTLPDHLTVALGIVFPVLPHGWEPSSAITSSTQKALPNTQSSLSIENSVLGTVLSAESRAGLKREGNIGQSIQRGRHGHRTLPQEVWPHRSPWEWHAGNRRAVISGKNRVMRNRTREKEQTDIETFRLAELLTTICNIRSMGKIFWVEKKKTYNFINKSLEPGQFFNKGLKVLLESHGPTIIRWSHSFLSTTHPYSLHTPNSGCLKLSRPQLLAFILWQKTGSDSTCFFSHFPADSEEHKSLFLIWWLLPSATPLSNIVLSSQHLYFLPAHCLLPTEQHRPILRRKYNKTTLHYKGFTENLEDT